MKHLLGGVGPGEELEPGLEGGRQAQRLARVGRVATRLVQPLQQGRPEAAGQPGAWQGPQVPHTLQAHALQRLPLRGVRAQQGERHVVQHGPQGLEVGGVGSDTESTAR